MPSEINAEITCNPDQGNCNEKTPNLKPRSKNLFFRFHDADVWIQLFVVRKWNCAISNAQQKCRPEETVEPPVKKHENDKSINPGLGINVCQK